MCGIVCVCGVCVCGVHRLAPRHSPTFHTHLTHTIRAETSRVDGIDLKIDMLRERIKQCEEKEVEVYDDTELQDAVEHHAKEVCVCYWRLCV